MSTFDAFELGEVREWREGFAVIPSLTDTISHWVGFERLMVALELIWPAFVEVRGCVLVPWAYEEHNFENWWNNLGGEHARIESVLNHTHLWDVFHTDGVSEQGLIHLGHVIAGTWSAALAEQFPARKFSVYCAENEDDYGPTIYFEAVD